MERNFSLKVDSLDADTVTLVRVPGTGVENLDFTSIVFEYGTARDASLFPVDDAEYELIIRRK